MMISIGEYSEKKTQERNVEFIYVDGFILPLRLRL